jgi:hypothetical protein
MVTGGLSRLRIDATNNQVGDEQVLIENNWFSSSPAIRSAISPLVPTAPST